MAPARPLKRQKTNPSEVPQSSQVNATQAPLPPDPPPAVAVSNNIESPTSKSEARSSFFSRTWPRKAAPSTNVARESASSVGVGSASATQETIAVIRDKIKPQRSPSIAMTLGKSPSNQSNRSLPANATTTIVNATPKSPTQPGQAKPEAGLPKKSGNDELVDQPKADNEGTPLLSTDLGPKSQPEISPPEEPQGPTTQETQAGWLAWLSKKDVPDAKSTESEPVREQQKRDTLNPSINGPIHGSVKEPDTAATSSVQVPQPEEPVKEAAEQAEPNNKRSWYQMWNNETSTQLLKSDQENQSKTINTSNDPPQRESAQKLNIPSTPKPKDVSQASSLETSPPPPLPGDSSKSSGWVFWSRDRNRPNTVKSDKEPHVGEIAISDTPSQARPKRASISLQDDEQKPILQKPTKDTPAKKVKDSTSTEVKGSPAKKQDAKKEPADSAASIPKSTKTTKSSTSTTKAESSNAVAKARDPVQVDTPRAASPAPSKKEVPNALLPRLEDTLSHKENPSILQQLARLLYYTKEPEFKHLHIVKDPPRIANALAIGVHGYFPAPLIRSVLGQPTGTSIKFADMAASAIKRWTAKQGYHCEVKSAALEGEGRIAERVELLWKLLLNWIDEIRKSDFVMIACHSQGVPVAIMLVAKLIAFGCISGARVGICAMAGVNMGPFQEYKSRWISGSAGELFEFSDPNSKVSLDYMAATEEILKHGVRLTYTGSIDDQLVSMESSIFAPITHPHIYRAVFIDGRIHAPNFLSHLVGFALKLRNVGVPDHGLIRELSPPLAGSLYSGEGHSRIYEDDTVYDLAISFALETNALKDIDVSKRPTTSNPGNPYILPFAMRGILEEDYVKTELQHEARELLAQFDEWKPNTKALKDVKFRLEGIRSKL
ncbi:hypothetical protein LTR84_007039 [Exophiala bonariae]|uniref:YMC020W-like alpha/beta hydrolase domain-containing protein n=1 Tax=Exophiala bonariae TaxID=1690606 RepID=A0AAV9N0L8_9EURO|nr:hypothetical protein LTR84_007039 [Exophiala bonariae]